MNTDHKQSPQKSPGACEGIRIVEIGTMVTAPYAAQILGDMGAEVIKIEALNGEIMRTVPPVYNGQSAAFAQWNRNKKSVALNLKNPDAVKAAHAIIATADALIINFRPQTAATYGFDYETLSKENPSLVYVMISGFGSTGPYSEYPAYDMVVQGMSGFMPIQGGDAGPKAIRSAVVDKIGAYAAVMALLAALLYRNKTGKGQIIEIPMMDAFAKFILPETFYTKSFMDAPEAVIWARDLYETITLADGHVIGFIMTQGHFEKLCIAYGLEELLHDPRFADVSQRNIHQKQLMPLVQQKCAHMTVAEFVAIARENELPFGPVYTLEQFMEDPQTKHNEIFETFYDDRVGNVVLLGGLARMSETPINAKALPPEIGEHTTDILRSVGYSSDRIEALLKSGGAR
jgi:crotonobetainyl-CoA:carnitine CoA-transferase CaiB-like acyl-CoA transferase